MLLFNPWSGCSKVAPGCKFCYAEQNMSVKLQGVKWGPNGTRKRSSDSYWNQPIKWDKKAKADGKRTRVFCASLADVFEEWSGHIIDHKGKLLWRDKNGRYADAERSGFHPYEVATMSHLRTDLFNLIDKTPNLDWLLLTKRPQNIRKMWPSHGIGDFHDKDEICTVSYYRDNCWVGCSVSEQETFDDNVDALLSCDDLGSVLFLSYEPCLGECDLTPFLEVETQATKWVIVGAESPQGGNEARMCKMKWVRDSIKQCKEFGVPCFVKQLGPKPIDENECFVIMGDSHGGDMDLWPEDIRVREFPE